MKCPSVAALWATTAHSHEITASVILPLTSSLFTGGSDGSVIHWSLNPNSVTPLSLLSGHAAPICSLAGTLTPAAVLSCCTAGVLCTWSGTGSGRCRRRRKLPPWSGIPLVVKQNPNLDGSVIVLCGSAEIEGKKGGKFVVLMVDCESLTVVKTVFHGGLSGLGFPLEMGVFGEEILLVDRTGRLQLIDGLEGIDQGSVVSFVSNSSDNGSVGTVGTVSEGFSEDLVVQDASFDQEGKVLALVYVSKCVFKWVVSEGNGNGNVIGEISLVGTSLLSEESKDKLVSGVFLLNEGEKVEDLSDGFMVNFALCSSNGAVLVFRVWISRDLFKFERLCEIPPISTAQEGKTSTKVYFSQFNKQFVRIESNCFTTGSRSTSLWRPHISTWSFENFQSNPNNLCNEISSGGLPCKNSSEKIVTASLVLSEEESFVPHCIIYGFNTGEIEVISFMESKSNFPYMSDKIFQGHTGPILCLAIHLMHEKQPNFSQTLISGSEDCTVRIWDLDSGILLAVLHHHVKPVRQIILPPELSYRPWADCFLSLGEDGCVALLSLETMRVERVITGQTRFPNLVAWDGNKGYIACLCKNLNLGKNGGNVLYIWDLKTGACDRVINGSGSSSMFDHFCKGIYKNALTGSVLGGNTSASSLLIPVFKDPKNPKKVKNKGVVLRPAHDIRDDFLGLGFGSSKQKNSLKTPHQEKKKLKPPIKCSCPFPGIASLQFDLSALMCHNSTDLKSKNCSEIDSPSKESTEGRLLRFSLCFLHLWGVDCDLDKLLVEEMNVCKPDKCQLATGTVGDRGAVSLKFPGTEPTLELWRSSPEFCAMRSLTMVSLAQHMISLSRSCANASSALAAFYTRIFAEKVPDIKPPSLQLLVSFWQHECEHVRMAARSLFHCSAPRAIPLPLSKPKSPSIPTGDLQSDRELEASSTVQSSSAGDLQSGLIRSPTGDLQSRIVQSRIDKELEASSIDQSASGYLQSDRELDASSTLELQSSAEKEASTGDLQCEAELKAFRPPTGDLQSDAELKAFQSSTGDLQSDTEQVSSTIRAPPTGGDLQPSAELEASSISTTGDLQSEQELEARSTADLLQLEEEMEVQSTIDLLQLEEEMEAQSTADLLQLEEEMEASSIIKWLDDIEGQEWADWVGATNQDSMASNIIVAAALVVWYPSIVKETLASTVLNHLIKLLMSMNEIYSTTAAELLAEGLQSSWIYRFGPEISRFTSDIFFQIECLQNGKNGPASVSVREALVEVLLPSLAVGDVLGFLGVVEGMIWGSLSDSVVHVVGLKTLIRVVRGNPKILAPHLEKVINYVLHTMDPSNLVMRKTCIITSMMAIKEIARVFPMVALNGSVTRLAVGDAIGDLKGAIIRIYDLESVTKIRILDASAPPGLPILLEGGSNYKIATAISALSFSPDGEGLVGFSERGVSLRWWSLPSAWWERLSSRSLDPVHCTKLIFLPPFHRRAQSQAKTPREFDEADYVRFLVQNLDLSYRLQWVGPKAVKLTRYNQDLGTFPLS